MSLSGIQSGSNRPPYYMQAAAGRNQRFSIGQTLKGSDTANINLRMYEKNGSGQKAVAAMGLQDGSSMSVFYSDRSTEENPVMRVKSWDSLGNEDYREVAVNEIDPTNCSYQELMAFTAYYYDKGELNNKGVPMNYPGGANGKGGYQDFFTKMDYLAESSKEMGLQFAAGNMQGFCNYKKEYDLLNGIAEEQGGVTRGQSLKEMHTSGKKKAPYSHMAKDGVIEYNGVVFSCVDDQQQLCLGDVSNRDKVLNIPMSGGGCLLVNRDNIDDLARAIGMFSPEDARRIMDAIAQDAKIQKMQKEIDDAVNSIGDEESSGQEENSEQDDTNDASDD